MNNLPIQVINAIERFEKNENTFDSLELNKFALNFDRTIFEKTMKEFVDKKSEEFFG